MDILQGLQNLVGQGLSGLTGGEAGNGGAATAASGNGTGALSKLLNPAVLGGLAGAFLSGRRGGILKGALLAGGGAYLWDKYKDRIRQANADNPKYGEVSAPDEKAQRIIRALVYAAKSDGHIDAAEEAAIKRQIAPLNFGPDVEAMIQKAMNESPDPANVARGVANEEEAMQLFTLSCAALDIDQFMEKNYLNALAAALNIPADVRDGIEAQVKAPTA